MAGVITDVAAMNAAAGHVEQVNGSLHSIIGALAAEAQGAQPFFKGGAGNEFQNLMNRYNDASKRLNDALAEIAVKIRENGKGYDNAEQTNRDAIVQAGNSGSLDIGQIV